MTKPELVTFIMGHTAEYKKTHLMEKHKCDLEVIAAEFSTAEETETLSAESATPENVPDNSGEPSDDINNYLPIPAPAIPADNVRSMILAAYEENAKIVKGRRLDKDEFKETVIDKVLERVTAEGITDRAVIASLTVNTMREFMENLIAFCPLNDNERKMLDTIPLLADYESIESQVNGMGFLQKVKELHNIEIRTSRALMVSLKKKRYITIEGGKKTYIVLLERGIRYFRKSA